MTKSSRWAKKERLIVKLPRLIVKKIESLFGSGTVTRNNDDKILSIKNITHSVN